MSFTEVKIELDHITNCTEEFQHKKIKRAEV